MKKNELPSRKSRKNFRQVASYRIKPEPFPRVLLSRAKFAARFQLSQTTADLSVGTQFRLNSIWDPDKTGTGNTVVGHSALTAIYGRYWVMGARVRISFNDPSVDGCRVGYRLLIDGNTTASSSTVQGLAEQPLTYMNGLNDTGSQKKVFNCYVKPWTLMGISKLEYLANSSTYSSGMTANPSAADNCLMEVFLVNAKTASSNVQCVVQITYDVKFYNRKTLTSSGFV